MDTILSLKCPGIIVNPVEFAEKLGETKNLFTGPFDLKRFKMPTILSNHPFTPLCTASVNLSEWGAFWFHWVYKLQTV